MTAAKQNGFELVATIKNGKPLATAELHPICDSRKSFYGKAKVISYGNKTILKSYDTFVCAVDNGKFKKLWDGYSATTMRHINEFMYQLGIDGGGKAFWDKLPVEDIDA